MKFEFARIIRANELHEACNEVAQYDHLTTGNAERFINALRRAVTYNGGSLIAHRIAGDEVAIQPIAVLQEEVLFD